MKKTKFIIFIMFVVLISVACENTLTTQNLTEMPTTTETQTTDDITTDEITTEELTTEAPTTEAPTTEAPTTAFVYDNRSLVPEDCEIIDNIEDWQPVWCDEFSVDGLPDSSKWLYDVGGSGWGNNELQYYTQADIDNAYVSDDLLHIKAIQESYGGRDYTSARLVTKYNGDWLYGKIQVRAKLPSGRGTWPAIWMLPTDWVYGGWPASGEIDIMEYVGYDPDTVHGTIHTGAYNHSLGTQIGYSYHLPTAEEEFHVYEMEWEPSSIKLFIDGVQFATFGYNPNINVDVENSDAWPFDQRFHLILNLAIGGDWGGAQGVDNSIFPQELIVDYVRVFQKDYAGMDQANPSKPTNLVLQDTTYDSFRFKWNHGNDDVLISHYDIYVDNHLEATTTLNAIRIDDLEPNTTYVVDIQSVDFAGNVSDFAQITVTTEDVPLALGVIQAEDYSSASGIQVEQSEDTDGTENVGYIDDNDSLVYTLRVEEAGTYQIVFRVASESEGGLISLYTKSPYPHLELSFGATGGWQIWTDVTSETFTLTEGVYDFEFIAEQGGFNLNYFEILKVD